MAFGQAEGHLGTVTLRDRPRAPVWGRTLVKRRSIHPAPGRLPPP